MGSNIEVGTRVAILVAGRYHEKASHEVTGVESHCLLICPIGRLGEIQPGQDWVPVTRITPDRVEVR